jgi:hypothetical protein
LSTNNTGAGHCVGAGAVQKSIRAGPAGQPSLLLHRQQLAPRVPRRCAVTILETPLGFVTLYEAVDAIGRAMFGPAWTYSVPLGASDSDMHEPVIRAIAEGCESGRIEAAYRKWDTSAEVLDRVIWQRVNWRTHFITGTIDLELPLLDEKNRPVTDGRTARCTRELFVRRDGLETFVSAIERDTTAQPSPTHVRFATDDELAREIAEGVKHGRWPNVHQAAAAVVDKAEGSGTRDSKITRVERKAAKLIKTNQKNSKD